MFAAHITHRVADVVSSAAICWRMGKSPGTIVCMKSTPAMLKHAHLVGKKFGNLTVQKILGPNRWRAIRARCLCDCGSVRQVVISHLLANKNMLCRKGTCHHLYTDIAGQKFSFLTAVRADRFEHNGTFWFFDCECGRRVSLNRNAVVSEKQKSCGCKTGFLVSNYQQARFPEGFSVTNKAYNQHVRDAKKRHFSEWLTKPEWTALALQPCVYCGDTSRRVNANTGKSFALNSVDRRNNEPYYRKENAVPCCFVCQRIKMDYPESYFIEHAKKIVRHSAKKVV